MKTKAATPKSARPPRPCHICAGRRVTGRLVEGEIGQPAVVISQPCMACRGTGVASGRGLGRVTRRAVG